MKNTSNTIIYVKAYCQCNLGDDLFLNTLVNRYPNVLFYFCERKENLKSIYNKKNVRYVGDFEYHWLRLLKKIKHPEEDIIENEKAINNSNAIVIIGGSLFIEKEQWTYKSNYFKNKPVFYIGCNFGPFRSKEYFDYKKKMIRESEDTCFRDGFSYNLFQDMGNVRKAPDVVWGYPYYPEEDYSADGIAISVMDFKKRNGFEKYYEQYETFIRGICERAQAKKIPVKLLAFCTNEGDMNAISRIINSLNNTDSIDTFVYDGEIDSFLRIINSCHLVIATRFHAMIIGWSLGKTVLPIIYSEKQTNTLHDISYDAFSWKIKEDTLPDLSVIDNLLVKKNPNTDFSNLKRKADDQFAALDTYLKNKC